MSRALLVASKCTTVGKVLLNHKYAAKSFILGSPKPCLCALHPYLPKDEDGHVACTGSHPAVQLHYGEMLSVNLSTPLIPSGPSLVKHLIDNFQKYKKGFLHPICGSDVQFISGNLSISPIPMLKACLVSPRYPHPYNEDTARLLKESLTGLVVTPLDRNVGRLYLRCQYTWDMQYMKLYHEDCHYEHVQKSSEEVMLDIRESYMQEGFGKYVKFDNKGSLGQAFSLPKNKDPINKQRPIVPNYNSPAKRLTRAVAAVLSYLLTYASILESFNITATKDLVAKLRAMNGKFLGMNFLKIFSFDVKNMYTNLMHPDLDTFLFQFLMHVLMKLKSLQFHVHKTKKKEHVHVGRNPGSQVFYTIPFKILHKVVMWDVKYCYFFAGDTILKQKIGLSMGSCCSPILAQIFCIICEAKWLQTLGQDERFISGVRFMDDVTIVVANHKYQLLHSFLNTCYPPYCQLDGDIIPTFVVPMLESHLWVAQGQVISVHNNKNSPSMFTSGVQNIARYTPFLSHSSFHTKRAAIIGVFYRMVDNTSAGMYWLLWTPVWVFIHELLTLGYPFGFLDDVLRVVSSCRFRCPLQYKTQLQQFFHGVYIVFRWLRTECSRH
jgi:hypothetical protein